MNNRIKSFDVIRGISAILVMLFHYTYRYGQIYAFSDYTTNFPFTVSWGYAAVTSFFILSGFFTAKQLFINQNKYSNSNGGGIFLIKRWMRLYPAFLICVCVTHIVTLTFFPSIACSTKDFLLNLTMIPGPLNAQPVDGAYWTLFVEWVYYVLIAMLLIRPSTKKTYIIMFIWLFYSIASNILYGKNPSGIPRVLNYVIVPSYSSCFISGIALWMIKGKINRYNAYGLLLLSQINAFLWYNVEILVLYGGTIIMVWLITNYHIEEIFERYSVFNVLSYYGRISYSFYLLHQMIGYILIYYLVKNGVPSVASLFISFVIITLGAHCVNVWSDRISLSLINKLSK